MNNMLNIKQASEKLKVKVSTLYAWVHFKKIPYVKLGSKLAFREDLLDKFIESNTFIPD